MVISPYDPPPSVGRGCPWLSLLMTPHLQLAEGANGYLSLTTNPLNGQPPDRPDDRPDDWPGDWKVSIDWSVTGDREPCLPDPRPLLGFARVFDGVSGVIESSGIPATITSLSLELRGMTASSSKPTRYPPSSVSLLLPADADPSKLERAFNDPSNALFEATASYHAGRDQGRMLLRLHPRVAAFETAERE